MVKLIAQLLRAYGDESAVRFKRNCHLSSLRLPWSERSCLSSAHLGELRSGGRRVYAPLAGCVSLCSEAPSVYGCKTIVDALNAINVPVTGEDLTILAERIASQKLALQQKLS